MSQELATVRHLTPSPQLTGGLARDFGLAGKTALITGATSGIGLAMAEAFADAGASLVIASNDARACRELAERFEAGGTRACGVPVELSDADSLVDLVDRSTAQLGDIDVLVANAGGAGPFGPMGAVTDTDWDALFTLNLRHPFRLANLLAPAMAARGGGSIIVTSSIAGLRGNRSIGLYSMTKAALMQMVRNLAVEWGPSGVRANAIAPGLIDTSWASGILADADAAQRRLSLTPLRRVGTTREVAATAVFLAGPGAGFITGQTIVVDGGTVISDGN